MLYWTRCEPVAGFSVHLAATEKGLRRVSLVSTDGAFTEELKHEKGGPQKREETPLLAESVRQLEAYFAGRLRKFEVPFDRVGTAFQELVWRALEQIPYGQTRSYAQIAAAIGTPKAVRAVGSANGRNPLPIFVPCHRVINSNGGLGGFSCGLEVKRRLLELEAHGAQRNA